MPVSRIHDEEIRAGVDQLLAAGETVVAHRGRGGHAKPPLLVLAGIGVLLGLLDVLDGDEADAVVSVVHNDQLFDAVAVQQPLRLVAVYAVLDGDEVRLRHQLVDRLGRIGREAHIAVGEDADQPPLPVASAIEARLDDGDARDAMGFHQVEGILQRGRRRDGQRVHDHAGFEFLDLPDLLGLHVRSEIAVNDAKPARLRHRDGERGFRDGVHRCRDHRDVEADAAGEPRAHIHFSGKHVRCRRLQQDVIEG